MKILNTKCGIWDTQYTLVEHRDGTVTLKAPQVKWSNNTGTLVFISKKFDGKLADKIKEAFMNQTEYLSGYECASLNDAVNGYVSQITTKEQ